MPKVENRITKKSGLQKLINLGKERGHISYDELNDALPDDVSSEEMEDVLSVLEGMNIDVFDNDEEVGGQGGQEEAIIARKESAVVDEEKTPIFRESAAEGNEEEEERYDRTESE
ncbi:MAG TPA: RNA polymerase sigma factor region1.1 domain-containing protein, partial [Candidatus Sumerlaeia bacterium]|nr:RNA polymerase sigma factor region1.1 domain-containing protein [Candidatus Sumerlaeia bacterium]